MHRRRRLRRRVHVLTEKYRFVVKCRPHVYVVIETQKSQFADKIIAKIKNVQSKTKLFRKNYWIML